MDKMNKPDRPDGPDEIHCAHLERRHPAAAQLASFGRLRHKRYRVQYTFETWHYSFILQGSGFFEHQGQRYQIEAPAMLHQWPQQPMHYGPHETWDECYLIYPPEAGAALQDQQFHPAHKPFWHLQDTARILPLIEELHAACQHKDGRSIDWLKCLFWPAWRPRRQRTETVLSRPLPQCGIFWRHISNMTTISLSWLKNIRCRMGIFVAFGGKCMAKLRINLL
jgi:hypothetical protein